MKMEKDLTFQDVLALRDLETEHGDHHALKSIAWVIGVVIVIAIIAWWIRRDRDCRENEYLHNGDHRSDYGEHKGIVKLLEKQVAALEEKAYYTHGKLDKLYGEFGCYTKYNTHEVEEIEARVYPKGYIGRERYEGYGEGCGCGERRHGNCGKKFVRQDTYTPNTQQVIVTEDCNCAA
jgi:hypothetical protein